MPVRIQKIITPKYKVEMISFIFSQFFCLLKIPCFFLCATDRQFYLQIFIPIMKIHIIAVLFLTFAKFSICQKSTNRYAGVWIIPSDKPLPAPKPKDLKSGKGFRQRLSNLLGIRNDPKVSEDQTVSVVEEVSEPEVEALCTSIASALSDVAGWESMEQNPPKCYMVLEEQLILFVYHGTQYFGWISKSGLTDLKGHIIPDTHHMKFESKGEDDLYKHRSDKGEQYKRGKLGKLFCGDGHKKDFPDDLIDKFEPMENKQLQSTFEKLMEKFTYEAYDNKIVVKREVGDDFRTFVLLDVKDVLTYLVKQTGKYDEENWTPKGEKILNMYPLRLKGYLDFYEKDDGGKRTNWRIPIPHLDDDKYLAKFFGAANFVYASEGNTTINVRPKKRPGIFLRVGEHLRGASEHLRGFGKAFRGLFKRKKDVRRRSGA